MSSGDEPRTTGRAPGSLSWSTNISRVASPSRRIVSGSTARGSRSETPSFIRGLGLEGFAGEVAGGEMPWPALRQRWVDLGANPFLGFLLHRQRTACPKVAPQ